MAARARPNPCLFAGALAVVFALWPAADAAAQVSCSGAPGLLTGMPVDDWFGSYSYLGGGALDGLPAVEFASGTGHHEPLGTEFTAALSARGLLVGFALRWTLVRAGLGEPWTPGRAPPTLAFLLTPRAGLALVSQGTRNLGAWLGVDAEWLLAGQLLASIRSGVYLPFDPGAALVRPIPMVTIGLGFAPGGAYGWL